MTIKLAELVADSFVSHLDMSHLTQTQSNILHAIRSVSMGLWARQTLKQLKGE